MRLLELSGSDFLQLYVLVTLIATGVLALVRWLFRLPASGGVEQARALDPYEIAYLAGGVDAAVDGAIASLAHNRMLAIRAGALVASNALPAHAHALERAVARALEQGRSGPEAIRHSARHALALSAGRLKALGFLVGEEETFDYRLAAAAVWGVPLCLGGVKVAAGIARQRPEALLIVLLLLTLTGALVTLLATPHRSRRGDRALELLRREHAALLPATATRPQTLAGHDVAIALGLFGADALAGVEAQPLRNLLYPPPEA